MPLDARMPRTEYMRTVKRAPLSLSEPNDRRLPITGPRSTRSCPLLARNREPEYPVEDGGLENDEV